MPINGNVRRILNSLTKEYGENCDKGSLNIAYVKGVKLMIDQTLKARISSINSDEAVDYAELFTCEFLVKMNQNGWTPTDLPMLAHLYDTILSVNLGDSREDGDKLIDFLEKTKINDSKTRTELINKVSQYINTFSDTKIIGTLSEDINYCFVTNVSFADYPEDLELRGNAKVEYIPNKQTKKGKPIPEFKALGAMAMRHNLDDAKRKEEIRFKNDYVISDESDKILESFNANEGQLARNITKSNREAIKEVYGDDIYDEIDEMKKGSEEERTVAIYHSMGNRYLKKGEEVLEIDFAGSGYKEVRREYHGQHGKTFTDGTRNTKASLEVEFGKLVDKKGGGKFKHLRSKTTSIEAEDGKTMEKTRYTIAGPTPDLWFKPGLLNVGEYSIENTRKYGKEFATDFLEKIFKKWDNGEVPHDVHINVTGHSRGAVAAGESIKLMYKWLKAYADNNPDKAHYIDKVKFDLVLRDPVPGIFTKLLHSKNDLRNIPNLEMTVFCSMAQEHYDMVFPLQNVRGAKRLIIGTTGHNMDLGQMDMSQVLQEKDGKVHKSGFYDAETGEFFRGSGINQMPEGVYIADDRFNLIRVTSYSQIGKLIDSVYDGKSKQEGRVDNIHEMVRNWFLDNDLKLSFTDAEERQMAMEDNDINMQRILASDNSRLNPIKNAINALNRSRRIGKGNHEIMSKEQELIDACRTYMKKTAIPAKGDSAYRMNLVSDVLSHTMRDKNYINKLLNPGLSNDGTELDKKISAHKERLANKEGYKERKLNKEEKRLNNVKEIRKHIKNVASVCEKYIVLLSKTRKNKSGSKEYNAMLNTLKDGEKLNEKITINEFNTFLNRLIKTSRVYRSSHDIIIGPRSDDGKTRLDYSKSFEGLGLEISRDLEKRSRFIPDKDKSVELLVGEKKNSVKSLNDDVEMKSPEKNVISTKMPQMGM